MVKKTSCLHSLSQQVSFLLVLIKTGGKISRNRHILHIMSASDKIVPNVDLCRSQQKYYSRLKGKCIMKKSIENLQYKLLTIISLLILPPLGIGMLCSSKIKMNTLAKVLIIIVDFSYFTILLMVLIFTARPA